MGPGRARNPIASFYFFRTRKPEDPSKNLKVTDINKGPRCSERNGAEAQWY